MIIWCTFPTTDWLSLQGILQTSAQPTTHCVLLCHGLKVDKDEVGTFSTGAKKLEDMWYHSFRFDFRWHGESMWLSTDMTITGETHDIQSALFFLQTKWYTTFSILFASFACGAASRFLAKNPVEINRGILRNPLIDYTARRRFPSVCLCEEEILDVGHWFKIGKKCIEEIKTYQPWRDIQRYSGSLLVIHGTHDSHVNYKKTIARFITMKNAIVVPIAGAEHWFHTEIYGNAAWDAVISFLEK